LCLVCSQFVADLFVESQYCRERGEGGIDIILCVELQQFGLNRVTLAKDKSKPDFNLLFVSSSIDVGLTREWSLLLRDLEQSLGLQRIVKSLVRSENDISWWPAHWRFAPFPGLE